MKKAATTLFQIKPRPTRCHRLDNPDDAPALRRLDCQGYDRCLDHAADAGWRGFHCNGCKAYEPLTPAQRLKDHHALLQLLAETQLLAGLDDEGGEVAADEDDDQDGGLVWCGFADEQPRRAA